MFRRKNIIKKLKILYEDKYIIAVYKDSGILTISTAKEKDNTLYKEVSDYVKKQNKNNRIFIIHRLDKDTSGIVLFAKTKDIKFKIQNAWNSVIRKYHALVEGKVLESGVVENYLKESKTYKTFITNDTKNGKLAITKYKPIKNYPNSTLLDIEILTGRKNQIRVHMASIMHPIIGDKKYGNKKSKAKRLLLNAYYLRIIHPINNKIIELRYNDDILFEKYNK